MVLPRYDCLTCRVRDCSILRHCDKETLIAISRYKVSEVVQKGERLFSEGDPVKGVHFVRKGFLKVELNGKHSRPLILQFAGRGSIFGYKNNVNHRTHSCSVTAVSDVQLCYIPYSTFDRITDNSPVLQQQIINQMLDDLELVQKKAADLAHKNVREKIAGALLMIAEVYCYRRTGLSFKIDFCRQDMADLAGTTKEQVSRTLKDFEKDKLIKCTARKFSYLNLERLRSISSGHEDVA